MSGARPRRARGGPLPLSLPTLGTTKSFAQPCDAPRPPPFALPSDIPPDMSRPKLEVAKEVLLGILSKLKPDDAGERSMLLVRKKRRPAKADWQGAACAGRQRVCSRADCQRPGCRGLRSLAGQGATWPRGPATKRVLCSALYVESYHAPTGGRARARALSAVSVTLFSDDAATPKRMGKWGAADKEGIIQGIKDLKTVGSTNFQVGVCCLLGGFAVGVEHQPADARPARESQLQRPRPWPLPHPSAPLSPPLFPPPGAAGRL